MTTTCCSTQGLLCDGGLLERPRYFPRQLISDVELTLEQQYFRDRLRRHNRLLHGWGVVCGALVCPSISTDGGGLEPWKVVVQPGYVLGPYGDEIVLDCTRTVDLRTSGVVGFSGDGGGDVADPWCSEIHVRCDAGAYYVAVKYHDCKTRPVRTQPGGCGCDDTTCEYSRWLDGYQIGVLRECPHPPGAKPDYTLQSVVGSRVPACPPCPTSPWVGLARVDVDARGGIVQIDNCDCRRMVASFSGYWWGCAVGSHAPERLTVTVGGDGKIRPGEDATVTLGGHFGPAPRVTADRDVHLTDVRRVDRDRLMVTLHPDEAAHGPRSVAVVNEDCTFATGDLVVEGPPPEACEPEPRRPVEQLDAAADDRERPRPRRRRRSSGGTG